MSHIIITGCSGQLGRALVPELVRYDHHVVGLDPSDGDLTDSWTAEEVLSIHPTDVIIHLAAQVGKLWCEDDPVHAWRSNALMTFNVADIARSKGCRFIYCSTSEVYGDHGIERVDEGTYCSPSSGVYAESKYVGEVIARSLIEPSKLQIWRPLMAYGPGVPSGRGRAAILNVIQSALDGEPIVVHAGGARSWCYTDDVARGMRMVFENGAPGIYNIGRDDDLMQMFDLARLVCEITGSDSPIQTEAAPPEQTLIKNISCRKLAELGFAPKVSLSEGIAEVAAYLAENRVTEEAS